MRRLFLVAIAVGVLLIGGGTLLPPHLRSRSAEPDPKALARNAIAYLQKSRALAEPSLLSRADALLQRSLELDGDRNFEAFLGMALLSNGRHDFAGSVEWARKAIATNPHNASPYGVMGDALFELGHYDGADRAYQKMIDIRPDLASYVRASYAYQFRGETKAAIGALRLALEAAGPKGEDAAWIRHQLGDVYFGNGQLAKAARQNRIGTRLAPGYIPPQVGLAEVNIARGRLGAAIATMEHATKRLPSLEYTITLGDLYAATGRDARAQLQYERVLNKIHDHYRHGVGPDADFILFFADHAVALNETLAQARRMYAQRPTAPVADALAWTLHKLGRHEEAWPLARRAAASPPQDPTFAFHAGVIASSLGQERPARALFLEAERSSLQLSPVQVSELESVLD